MQKIIKEIYGKYFCECECVCWSWTEFRQLSPHFPYMSVDLLSPRRLLSSENCHSTLICESFLSLCSIHCESWVKILALNSTTPFRHVPSPLALSTPHYASNWYAKQHFEKISLPLLFLNSSFNAIKVASGWKSEENHFQFSFPLARESAKTLAASKWNSVENFNLLSNVPASLHQERDTPTSRNEREIFSFSRIFFRFLPTSQISPRRKCGNKANKCESFVMSFDEKQKIQ